MSPARWRPSYLRPKFLIASAAILAGLIVLQFASGWFRRIPTVNAEEAQALIAAQDKPLVLAVLSSSGVMSKGVINIMSRLADETGDSFRFAQIELTDAPEIAKYVQSAPTMLVFDKGKLRANRPIIETKEDLVELLK